MVAGTVVTLMGGTPSAVGHAASIALQNTFGVPCDPIAGGGCPMPCLTRIVLAAINGIVSADMAISGFDSLVPYDQVVEALGKMYDAMPGEFKCTFKRGNRRYSPAEMLLRSLH
jgi:L-serine dehydratase